MLWPLELQGPGKALCAGIFPSCSFLLSPLKANGLAVFLLLLLYREPKFFLKCRPVLSAAFFHRGLSLPEALSGAEDDAQFVSGSPRGMLLAGLRVP